MNAIFYRALTFVSLSRTCSSRRNLLSFSYCTGLSFDLKDPSLLLGEDGKSSAVDTSSSFDVIDPSSLSKGDIVARVRLMAAPEAHDCILRSEEARAHWKLTTGLYRSGILQKWSKLLTENTDDLAKIMTLESGKPLVESRGEIRYASSFLDFYSGEALRPTGAGGGQIIPTPFEDPTSGEARGSIFVKKMGVGVCGMITPWNFPTAMITRKVGPALAAGCTAVVKPSKLTPLSAIAAWNLGRRAGIPPGVFELM